MAFKRLFPYAPVLAAGSLSGVAGWFLKGEQVKHEAHTRPGPFIQGMADSAADPSKIYAAMVVQAANRSGRLQMAGATFTDEITSGVTRRSVGVNVYSRIAAGSTVTALRETSDDGIQILLLKNKRKAGKLLPSEGYGKFGPQKHTGEHFSDLEGADIDEAEELILRGMPVDEAYEKIAAKTESGKYAYGDFDGDFTANALRELREETGLKVNAGDMMQVWQRVDYNERYGLHTCVTGFLTVLSPDVAPTFAPDATEIESIHMVKLTDIEVQADGSAKVKGFTEVIPADYVKKFEQGIIAYEEMQLAQISGGRITKVAALEVHAASMGRACPKLALFGTEQPVSSANFREFARYVVASTDQACRPFLRASAMVDAPKNEHTLR